MEWFSDFNNISPLEETLYGFFSPPQPQPQPQASMELPMAMPMAMPMEKPMAIPMEKPMAMPMEKPKPHEWTREENKIFENAIAENDPTSPAFLENIGAQVPWRSIGDIKSHYEALVRDVELIESGKIPVPDYPLMEAARNTPTSSQKDKVDKKGKGVMKDAAGSSSSSNGNNSSKTKSTGQPRRRGVPWTEDEHQLFLMGLNKFGKGDWRSISRYYVISKTPTQVASHAQKYYRRLNSSTPQSRRRPSIHDVHTVNPGAAANASSSSFISGIPSFPSFHHSFGMGGHVLEPIPPPLIPPNSYKNLPSSCFFASLRNQQWGWG